MKILLIEPDYRSKFPPLGLLKLSTYHKSRGDEVIFSRGCKQAFKNQIFNRIYISSLFTYELPRTLKTIKFYRNSVMNPKNDIIVGGVGATLLPEYLLNNADCKVITGVLDKPNKLGLNEPPISNIIPDYNLLNNPEKQYTPANAYFTRVTIGCIRNCKFCAVPILEPEFSYHQSISEQVNEVIIKYGEKKDLIVFDNNILATENIKSVISEIVDLGFYKNSKFDRKLRVVDFNQGIDARLITRELAEYLGKICLYPVRLALDHISVKKSYEHAVNLLSDSGFRYFTTYVMFNFSDKPESFYERLKLNLEISIKKNIRITGFPMKYAPIDSVDRHHISKFWNWRYLRGIQCVLNATHGMVSPNPNFFDLSFGKDFSEFTEIISMPDDYIVYRNENKDKASEWRKQFRRLSNDEKNELFHHFEINHNRKSNEKHVNKKINKILEFYLQN